MMAVITDRVRNWAREVWDQWDRFWFVPQAPHTLAVIRILAGSMMLYTHLVWALALPDFTGEDGLLPNLLVRTQFRDTYVWSYLWHIDSPTLLWSLHAMALLVLACFTVGLWTPATSVLSWLITISYCHRFNHAFFGLDQINALLAMYLMLGPSGAVFSVDRWHQRRQGRGGDSDVPHSVRACIAIRLIQLHMCVIYLFGGISKLRGEMWWDGSAVWYAIANTEYQSLDVTWLVHAPWLIALLTHATVIWEVAYCALIWPRMTRPFMLSMAIFVHSGIAMFLGMITFGLVMLIGNCAFVSPRVFQRAGELWRFEQD